MVLRGREEAEDVSNTLMLTSQMADLNIIIM